MSQPHRIILALLLILLIPIGCGYGINQNQTTDPNQAAVVFIGDSLTYRWPMPAEISGYRTVNRGIDANKTSQMAARFDLAVLALKPDLVIIFGGINDILTTYRDNPAGLDSQLMKTTINLGEMIDQAQKAGIKPIICTVAPVANKYYLPASAINPAVEKLNLSIKELAAREQVQCLDLWAALADSQTHLLKDEYATPDGLHFTNQAYDVILKAVTGVLARQSSMNTRPYSSSRRMISSSYTLLAAGKCYH